MKLEIILGEFKTTGINEIDINLVCKKWNHLWFISEWKRDNSWTLTKHLRKDSDIRQFRTLISQSQARELIENLSLVPFNSPLFRSGCSWKKP